MNFSIHEFSIPAVFTYISIKVFIISSYFKNICYLILVFFLSFFPVLVFLSYTFISIYKKTVDGLLIFLLQLFLCFVLSCFIVICYLYYLPLSTFSGLKLHPFVFKLNNLDIPKALLKLIPQIFI